MPNSLSQRFVIATPFQLTFWQRFKLFFGGRIILEASAQTAVFRDNATMSLVIKSSNLQIKEIV